VITADEIQVKLQQMTKIQQSTTFNHSRHTYSKLRLSKQVTVTTTVSL